MEENKKDSDLLAACAVYGAAGLQLAISVVASLFLGSFFDKKLGISPWLTLAGIILGFTGGMVNLVRILGWFGERGKNG